MESPYLVLMMLWYCLLLFQVFRITIYQVETAKTEAPQIIITGDQREYLRIISRVYLGKWEDLGRYVQMVLAHKRNISMLE